MKIDVSGGAPTEPQQPRTNGVQQAVASQGYTPAPNRQQAQPQQQGKQDGYPNPQNNNGKKLLFVGLTIILAGVLAYLVIMGYASKMKGNGSSVAPSDTVVVVPAKGTEGEATETTMTTEQLVAEVQRLTEENKRLQQTATQAVDIPGAPPSVTAISSWQSSDPNIINASETRDYTELVPYTKKYTKLASGAYMFSLLVNYGGQDYILGVTYKDYALLKDQGVIACKVETATIMEGETPVEIVTGILVHPEWQRLTTFD